MVGAVAPGAQRAHHQDPQQYGRIPGGTGHLDQARPQTSASAGRLAVRYSICRLPNTCAASVPSGRCSTHSVSASMISSSATPSSRQRHAPTLPIANAASPTRSQRRASRAMPIASPTWSRAPAKAPILISAAACATSSRSDQEDRLRRSTCWRPLTPRQSPVDST